MLTLEEKIAISLDGESERQNTTTDIVVGNIERSKVQSMIDAMKSSNRTDGRDRFQELMNLLPEDSAAAKKIVMSFLRQMLKEDLDKSGITGTQRTKALQKLSAIVTNYVKNADKKWSVENDMRFPHVSGSGIVVAKRGDKAEWTTNTGEKVVGVIVDLRRQSGPRGNDDFVRMQFLDPETGKLFTVPSDLAATNMRIVDASTPVIPFQNWKRNVPLAFERGGQDFADRRAKALAKRTEQRRIRLLGSDGEPQDDSSETVEVVSNRLTKQATQLLPGDTIYDTKGKAIGSVVKTKMTSAKGKPIVAVMYKDVNGNVQKIAYEPDQEIGPDAPKA
jgi:SpoVK/Ycf46/Vps4 family AAA+-type ATPase